ncbi:MAG: phytanoyl-CoA dioxygenase family protein [Deinococcus sp.]|nr:phytanoyl-CoA dioxygenase family protein [Deinococcus sp.]
MTPEEKYRFDLNGYLVIEQALPPELVAELNQAVDEIEALGDDLTPYGATLTKLQDNIYFAGGGETRKDGLVDYSIGNLLAFGGPFETLIDLPNILPYIAELIGTDYRLDAASILSRSRGGGTRFHHCSAELLPYCEYAVVNGAFQCVSIKVAYALTAVGPDDGPFVVIPGSHKSAFPNPYVAQVDFPPQMLGRRMQPLPVKAGDAIIFTEDIAHGALRNRGDNIRRTIFYSYAPTFQAPWPGLVAPKDLKSPTRERLVFAKPPYW